MVFIVKTTLTVIKKNWQTISKRLEMYETKLIMITVIEDHYSQIRNHPLNKKTNSGKGLYAHSGRPQLLEENNSTRLKNKINDLLCPLEGHQTGHEKDQRVTHRFVIFVFY